MDEMLLQTIHDAFPDGHPPQRPLTGHRCPECDQVDVLLGERVWSDVAARFPTYCHDAFPLLTAAAQTYYLPAYMIAALQEDSGLQGSSLETALAEGGLDHAAFSRTQRRAIVQWLEAYWHLVHGEEPPTTLVSAWAQDVEPK